MWDFNVRFSWLFIIIKSEGKNIIFDLIWNCYIHSLTGYFICSVDPTNVKSQQMSVNMTD